MKKKQYIIPLTEMQLMVSAITIMKTSVEKEGLSEPGSAPKRPDLF